MLHKNKLILSKTSFSEILFKGKLQFNWMWIDILANGVPTESSGSHSETTRTNCFRLFKLTQHMAPEEASHDCGKPHNIEACFTPKRFQRYTLRIGAKTKSSQVPFKWNSRNIYVYSSNKLLSCKWIKMSAFLIEICKQ